MDWVRNNKFLAGFIAVMIIGLGGVGYFLYSAQAHYGQVSQEYNSQVTELQRLERLDPYPEESNLKRFGDQKAAFAAAVTGLQSDLAKISNPAEKSLSPSDFQNRLREIVSDLTRLATQVGVGLPDGFYLGFEQYKGQLPDAAATPLLTVQMTELDELMRILINHKVDKIGMIKRAPLPGENGVLAANPTPGPGERPKNTGNELVTRYPVEINFSASPNAFRDTLAEIIKAPRLFVARAMQVKNQVDKGPLRGQEAVIVGGAAPAAAPAPAPAAAAGGPENPPLPEKGPPPLRYVVGQEKLEVVMNIELVRVMPPR